MSQSPFFNLDWIQQTSFVAQVEWHDLISSTNDRGMKLAGDGAIATPYLILAGQQTAGRGRGTNRWWSDSGALTFSLIFDPQADQVSRGSIALEIDRWPRIALAAGVALCDLLQDLVPNSTCGLKWPNDVLLAGKKVAGILAEVPPAAPPAPRRIVLGMGMNVNNSLETAPPEICSTGTSLFDETGDMFDLTDVIVAWLEGFADHLHHLAIGDPGLPFRWQSLCALLGKKVELQSGNRAVHGLCRGIDAEGALLVDTETGPERLYAGVLVRAV